MTEKAEKKQLYSRELPPIQFWSATLWTPHANHEEIVGALKQSAYETGYTYSGFFTGNDHDLSYTFTRYPRHKYGIATIDACMEALLKLNRHLRDANIDVLVNEFIGKQFIPEMTPDMRVLMGREAAYGTGKVFDQKEYEHFLNDESFSLQDASIQVVGPGREYQEPASVIYGYRNRLEKLVKLATQFQQSRFTVENLREGTANVVETMHADHDPEPTAASH